MPTDQKDGINMIYPYQCKACEVKFDVIKCLADMDNIETCPTCSVSCDKSCRYISRTHFYGASDWDNAEYNPAFGKVIRNKKHRDQEAKRRGMVEIGNEKVENIHKHSDQTLKDNLGRRWDEIDTSLGDVRSSNHM